MAGKIIYAEDRSDRVMAFALFAIMILWVMAVVVILTVAALPVVLSPSLPPPTGVTMPSTT